jgi:hypothetical protein
LEEVLKDAIKDIDMTMNVYFISVCRLVAYIRQYQLVDFFSRYRISSGCGKVLRPHFLL